MAPAWALQLTKSTLADLVWELAAVAPGVECCDSPADVVRIVREAALQVKAPRKDVKIIEAMLDAYRGTTAPYAPATEPAPAPSEEP